MNFTFFEEDFLFFASHNYCTIYGLRRFITLRTQITMEDEMVANVQNMKIEVEEVKVEMAEVNSESFGIEQNSCGLVVEDDHDERTDRIIDLQRIKEEHNYVKTRSNKEVLEMQGKKIKVEESWEDPKPFDPIYITEEDTFKVEQNDVLIDGNAKTALNSGPQQEIQRQNPEVCKKPRDELYSCYNCNYSTFYKYHLIKHMKLHCNTKFVSKKKLDNHAVRKHPNFIEPISSKIQECSQCTFATAQKSTLDKHMLKHSETKDELKMCMDCDRVFKNERWLVNHRIKQHSDSIQVFKCIHCTYKTTLNSSFDRHMLKHLGTTDDHMAASDLYDCKHCTYKTSLKTNFKRHKLKHFKRENRYRCVCAHCGLTLISLRYRDEHVVRKHPDSIASITRKIYKCKYCSYKTTLNQRLSNHILKHPETVDSSKLHNCTHCGASFKSKKSIDEHMVKRHPDFIASVSSKIHVCKYCTYKSTVSYRFAKHMLKHSGAVRHKYRKCTQCGAAFTSKAGLDDHTIRKHPDFIGSISRKIHACILCSYKTTLKSTLTRHTRQHYPEIRRNFKLNSCSHCTATFASKQNLNEHALQKHPYVNSTVTSKIHKCTFCPYKTTIKYNIDKHMMSKQHSQESQVTVISTNTRKLKRCNHCDAVFKRRENLDNHIVMKHPDFAASVSRKIHACKYCTYKTTMKYRITKHERKHTLNHIKAPKAHRLTHKSGQCTRCGAAFKSKRGLDDHTIRKHPDLIGFITCKIHVCTLCPYKTTLKCNLTEHMLQHYPKTCSHCKATFKSKLGLDDHTLREHPHVTSTVTSKIYKCILCPYETAIKYNIDNHMSKQHSQESQVTSTNTRKLKMCNHCDAVFKRRENLDNHIVMKHPDFAASVSCKIHACKYCTYKTAISYHITKHERKHMLNHLKAPKAHRLKHKSGKCTQCGAAFKSKAGLDEHTIRKHPDFIGFITCKILVCTLCSYKTTFKASLTRHMSKHSETQESPKPLSSCSQCKVTFKSKQSLDKHICGASVNIIVFHQNKKVFQRKMYYRRFFYCTILYLFITMEDEMAAIVQNMKIEVEEVKVEVAEVNIESFGIEQNSWRLAVEEEHNYVKAKSNMEIFEMQGEKIKVEENWEDCKPFEPMYITEEDIFKLEKNDDLIDGNAKIALNSGLQQEIQRQNPEVCEIPRDGLYSCYNYNYSTFYKYHLIKHMKLHCNTKFASKEKLDNHAVRKHPDFIEPISSKIQECSQCTFATAQKATLDKHMLKHSETKDELKMCMDCDRVFKNERWLVNHIIKEHSDSIQVFKCIHCTYKTNLKSSFDRHMFKHLGTTDDHMAASDLYDCKHCTYKTSLKTNFKRHKLKHSKRANRYRCITMEAEMAAIVQNMKIEVEEVKMEMAEVDFESFGIEQNSWRLSVEEEHNYVKAKSNMEDFEVQGEKIKVEENWEDCKSFEPMYITEEDLFKLEKNDDLIDGTAIIALNSGPQQEIQRHNPEVCKKPRDELYSCYNCNYSTFYKYHLIKHMKLHCSTKFASKKKLDNHAVTKHPDFIGSLSCKMHLQQDFRQQITMENEMVANIQNMKIEVEGVKVEMAEVDIESFGIEQNSWRLAVEGDHDETTDRIIDLHRIKEEHNYVKTRSNMEVLEQQDEKIKVEEDLKDYKPFEPMYFTEEDTFKLEKNDDSVEGNLNKALNSGPQQEIQRQNLEVCRKSREELYSCYNCNYTTFYKYHLIKHMKLHCNTKFASKKKLDNHTIKKHLDFIESISSKIREWSQCTFATAPKSTLDKHMLEHSETKDELKMCTNDHMAAPISRDWYDCKHCTYKTSLKTNFKRHMLKHSKRANRYRSVCAHCGLTLISLRYRDEHVVRKHPDSIASITRRIYECKHCSYKTTLNQRLSNHIIKHPETVDSSKLHNCIHCGASFKSKIRIDEHTIKKHPDFIASVSSKIHACKYCTYKSVITNCFDQHMLKHSGATVRHRYRKCTLCGAAFKSEACLDEHTIRKHPDFSGSISREINVCTLCPYKTIWKSYLTKHLLLEHPETQESPKPLSSCSQCTATFKTKRGLDDHTLRNHPHVTSTVTSKIHKCTLCPYKSSMRDQIDRHMSKHSLIKLITNEGKLNRCNQCHAVYKRKEILDHIIRKHPDFSESISGKISVCRFCPYKTTWKSYLKRHLLLKHPETQESPKPLSSCSHCTATFKSKIGLTEHTLQKHPHAASTVTSKLHKCTLCPYKTAMKRNIDRHMPKHSQTKLITNKHKLNRCNQCEAAYIRRDILDDHIIRKHPDLIASVSRKIHACKYCTYKSTISHRITKHMLKHSEATDGSTSYKIHECTICPYNTLVKSSLRRHLLWKHPETKESPKPLNTCSRCKATFKRKQSLDEHTLRKHSHVTSAVTSKIHKCTLCPYTTTMKISIDRHISKHSQIKLMANKRKLNWCNQCDAVYIKREFLDEHIIRKHPDLVDSVSRKIHACKYCTFKSTLNYRFTKHMLKHSETQESPQLPSSCRQCKATFKSKRGLDEHTLKKHPHVTSTVTSKIHKCTLCPYKTIITMEDETAANVQNMKIEVEEVKVEMAEVNIESFGIEQISWGLAVQGDHDERTDRIIDLQRMKEEHNYVKTRSNMEVLEVQGEKIKVEENWEDYKPFDPLYFNTEEDTIKLEKNDDLIDGNTKPTLNSDLQQELQRQNLEVCKKSRDKLYSCYNCNYSTFYKYHLIKHMKLHCNTKFASKKKLGNHAIRKHPDFIESMHVCTLCSYKTNLKSRLKNHMLQHYPETLQNFKLSSCGHCKATFKSKTSLDDHILRKHPQVMSTVTSKIHKCTLCPYKTTRKFNLTKHMWQHYPETRQNFKLSSCSHCKATFKSKKSLDDHTLRKHPHVMSTVTSKIHKCTRCPYKTTLKFNLTKHMLQHYPEARQNFKLSSCSHCKATFKSKTSLDGHTLKKHPHVTSTVTSKIHKCTLCAYKTTLKFNLTKHMLRHYPEARQNFKLSSCNHCKATFKSKTSLDDHTLRKHPHVMSTVTSKIHKCTLCPYKTTSTFNLTKHMWQHYPETRQNFKLSFCSHCKATFKSKTSLDGHTLRKHPHVTSTVTSKIHKCTLCPYKTTLKSNLTKHMLQHYPEARQNFKLSSCSHCKATFKSKTSLDDHTLRKHPHVMSTVTSKIHKCTLCPYKTTMKFHLTKHMWQHYPETRQNFKLSSCSQCKATFKSKTSLDDHTLRKHPQVTSSVTCKIHKCTLCPYKTTSTFNLTKHMWQHSPETQQNFKLSSCSHCKATFKSKTSLDDHTLRKHRHVTSTVTSKIHKCTVCPYKTTLTFNLTKHMWQHYPETRQNFKLSSCSHCKATFKSKLALDDHTLRKHPHVTSTVTSKIHKCTFCPYKTTKKFNLTKHMLQHYPETRQNFKLSSCSHCKATFKSKLGLDDHTLRKHPHVTSTVASKIHKCTFCPYKTTKKFNLTKHMLQHYPETRQNFKLSSCSHCKATFKSKTSLDNHTLRKHPHVTSTVTSKIHKCTLCPYKTTRKYDLTCHMLQHYPKTVVTAKQHLKADEHNFVEAGSNIQLPEMQGKKIKVEENWEDYKSFEPLQFTEVDTIKLEKNDDLIDGNTEITLNGIKDEHNFVEPGSNIEVPELQEKKIKLEENWEDSIPFEPMYITNEDICKIKKNDDLIDENTKTTLNSDPQQEIQRQNLEVCKRSREELYSCYNCNYTTFYKNHLIKHMKLHCITKFASKKKIDATARKSTLDKHMLEHSETKDELKICIDCHMVFKNERWLVNHRNKEHSDSVQVFKCIHCKYKTTLKSSFDRHMLKHLGTTDDHMAEPISLDWYHCKHCTYKTSLKTNFERHMLKHSKREKRCRNVCRHCGLTLMSPRYLDEHMVRKHPDSIASITRKIYECKHCSYKTCLNDRLSKHNKIQHPETVDSSKLHNCIHCGASFKCKRSMDEHIIRRHPDFIASVSSKIHACKYCTYKSTVTHSFEQHMLKHSGATDRHKYRKCTECGAVFKNKVILDDHTIRKHPHVTSTVTNKIHECTLCPYKTTKRSRLTSHMLQHYPETCSHCKETFKSKLSLTEHIVRKHPQLTSTVTTKIHECTFCPYKTTKKSHIDWHMSHSQHSHSQHSQIKLMTTEGKLKKCNHCDAVYERKESLDDHIIRKHPDLIAYISRKIHTCKYCTFKSTVSSAMTKHMSRHSDTTDGSISSKIHECTLCSYKTTFKVILTRHMLRQHPETQESPELLSSCSQCKEAFRRKQALDEHILRKHPHVTSIVTSKIHECTLCSYKTTFKVNLTRHMLRLHPETQESPELLSSCSQCKATFRSKQALDEHTLQKHPHVTSTVTSKIHECTLCPYKTSMKNHFDRHISKHSQIE
ncbi:unnamed protein product [Callosobruchus maculatus]|uniref:C2H2-type domain-containing protein n=1 Tax=Callosobruchus maculatus TaxID=64391 RepID=A0A653D001_CALMS|nr:unnamed protein product [Callosobruchus maculatus]